MVQNVRLFEVCDFTLNAEGIREIIRNIRTAEKQDMPLKVTKLFLLGLKQVYISRFLSAVLSLSQTVPVAVVPAAVMLAVLRFSEAHLTTGDTGAFSCFRGGLASLSRPVPSRGGFRT